MQTWLIIVIVVLVLLLVSFFLVTFIPYLITFYNGNKFSYEESINHLLKGEEYEVFNDITIRGIKNALDYPHKDYVIKSHDGLKLHGRFYELNKGAPIILEFHGYKGNSVRDLAGGLNHDKKEGYNIFMVNHRGHGLSSSRTITFGIKERYDVLTWVEFLNKEFNNPTILLYGISMGAATVLMASSFKFPSNVKGIIADCPYSSPIEIVTKVANDMGIKEWFSSPILKLSARLYGHFNLTETSALEEVKNTTLPILLIHGTKDTFVPKEMSMKIKEANTSKVQLELFEGAPHGFSCYVDIERYFKLIKDFTNNVMNS